MSKLNETCKAQDLACQFLKGALSSLGPSEHNQAFNEKEETYIGEGSDMRKKYHTIFILYIRIRKTQLCTYVHMLCVH